MVHRVYVVNPDYGFLYGYSILTRFLTRGFRSRIKFLDQEVCGGFVFCFCVFALFFFWWGYIRACAVPVPMSSS